MIKRFGVGSASLDGVTRQELSDEVWAVLEPLLPVPKGWSRPWTDHRLAVEGMAWKYRTGATDLIHAA